IISTTSKPAMKRYLSEEGRVWQPMLDHLQHSPKTRFGYGHGAQIGLWSQVVSAFERASSEMENASSFNQCVDDGAFPPASTSAEGQVILALFADGHVILAENALLAFLHEGRRAVGIRGDNMQCHLARGSAVIDAAKVASVLPFHKVSSHRLAGSVRSAEVKVQSLDDTIQQAEKKSETHSTRLSQQEEKAADRNRRIERVRKWQEERRQTTFDKDHATNQHLSTEFFKRGELRLMGLNGAAKERFEKMDAEFRQLKNLFHSQLQFRAPVELWESRSKLHDKRASKAMYCFAVLTGIAITAGLAIPYFAGSHIAESFATQSCTGDEPISCERVFSAKGPLTVSGLLLAMSLLMWTVRLQYRVYLSERHLSLDASEKKAFAQTYLAMREGHTVDAGNEAIVLASLFKPTQDGIIKDDANSLDLSAAAVLAKQMGKS
ncbi:MAG: DUF6161 domain-containing protein, partial [Pseudomonadota bacterium]|nr:DUF6161 domain-containing protein [Pseudomonadota bacterium]